MTRLAAVFGFVMLVLGRASVAFAQAAQPGGTLQQEGFTPIEQLPPQDQLPAAPLLIGAYVFVIAALFLYVFSLATRLKDVQQQMQRLEGDIARGKKG